MATITLRVIDGADRGRVFNGLIPPITIGREEGNTVQLNDDRVSRYHLKIQEDDRQLVLTDLESTNGTRVNNEDVQLRILRHGDCIKVGRSLLIFGSRDEIALRLAALREQNRAGNGPMSTEDAERLNQVCSLDFELNWSKDEGLQSTLHLLEPPNPPQRLSAGQAAQLSEMIEYIHIRIRRLLDSVQLNEQSDPLRASLDLRQWQTLVDIQAQLSNYLHSIGNPRELE